VGHLNELQEKYGSKGLTVLAVTDEGRGLVDKYVEETGATHPIVIESSNSTQAWGVSGFPSSFVVAPDGTIAYAGHPSGVTDELIEGLLKDVRLFPEVPKSLEPVVKKLEKDDFAGAVALLEKLAAKEGSSEEETAAAAELQKWIDWRGANGVSSAETAVEKGDFYRAAQIYEDLAKVFKGLEIGTKAQQALDDLLADKERKREVDAGEDLAKAKVAARDLSAKKAIKLFERVAKKYEGTKAGEEARQTVERLANAR